MKINSTINFPDNITKTSYENSMERWNTLLCFQKTNHESFNEKVINHFSRNDVQENNRTGMLMKNLSIPNELISTFSTRFFQRYSSTNINQENNYGKNAENSHKEFTMKKIGTSENCVRRNIVTSNISITLLLFFLVTFGALAQIDLKLGSSVTPSSKPAIGSTIKFTVWVVNSGQPATKTITIKNVFPSSGASISSSTASRGTFDSTTGLWTIPSMATSDSVALEITALVQNRGIYFNTAEVQSIGEGVTDVDSTPANGVVTEDDFTASCFTVPLLLYSTKQQYTISLPKGYKNIQWYKDGVAITSSPCGTTAGCTTTVAGGVALKFTNTGNNLTTPFVTKYVLTDGNGLILTSADNTTSFTAPATTGTYKVYGVNYDGSKTAPTFTVNTTITAIGGACVATSTPLLFCVCTPTSTSSVGAVVNADSTLTITSKGNYTFVSNLSTCASSGCCGVEVIDGVFDLALRKTMATHTAQPGQNVTVNITVFNQGNITAKNIDIIDYIPTGFTVPVGIWSVNGTGTVATSSIAGPLYPGDSAKVNIDLQVKSDATAGTSINAAEITAAKDAEGSGSTVEDVDSTPDNNPSNDGTPKNDVISEHRKTTPTDDEDDHDIESITITNGATSLIDLSLTKAVSAISASQGDSLTYYIKVTNNGVVAATGVEVTDQLPAGVTYISATNGATQANGIVTGKFAKINVGETAQFNISTKITATTGSITNSAQVSKANETDVDSTPSNMATSPAEDDNASATTTLKSCSVSTPIISTTVSSICKGDTTTLTATNCSGIVTWSDAKIGTTIKVSPAVTTTYTATCTVNGCVSSNSNQQIITINANVPPVVTASSTTVCGSGKVTLTATSCTGGTLTWSSGGTGTSISVSPTATTDYFVTCAGNTCSSGKSNTIKITVGTPSAAPVVTASSATVCKGTSVTLTATGCAAGTVVWSNNLLGTNSSGSSLTFTPAATASYSAQCQVGECIGAKSSDVAVTVSTGDIITVTSSKDNVCVGESVTLTAIGCGGTITWTGNKTGTTLTINPTTTASYIATCSASTGSTCASTVSKTVTVVTKTTAPTIASNKNKLCSGESAVLTATGCAGTIAWAGSALTTTTLTVSPTVTTSYTATCSVNGCVSDNSTAISVVVDCTTSVAGTADVAIVKTSDSTIVANLPSVVTYKWTITNNGPETATKVVISDHLPAGLTFLSSTDGLALVGDSLATTINSLAKGSTATFTYKATLNKVGLVTNTAKIIKADQPDPIKINNTSSASVQCTRCQSACIVLALAADTTKKNNGSYDIKFRAVVSNCGNLALDSVSVVEDLATMFKTTTTPLATFTIAQAPSKNLSSNFVVNPNYNGTTNTDLLVKNSSKLAIGKQDTISFTVNLVPNNNVGPFTTNAIGSASGIATNFQNQLQQVSDISTNGLVPIKGKREPTVVQLFGSPAIALTYKLLDSTKKADGSYNLTYLAIVKNTGSTNLTNITLSDTLSNTFKTPVTFTMVSVQTVNSNSKLIINTAYNGGTNPNLTLAATSQLAIGKIDTIKYIINVKPLTTPATYTSKSTVSGQGIANGLLTTVKATSQTSFVLNGKTTTTTSESPCIGLAMYVKDTLRQTNGSYNITYQAILKNCGNVLLKNVSLVDSLTKTYKSPVTISSVKISLSAGSNLKVNPSFNGGTNPIIILGDSTSTLAVNKVDTVTFVINAILGTQKGPFSTNSIASGTSPAKVVVTDISNDGLDFNPIGSIPTVINFKTLPSTLVGIAKSVSTPVKISNTIYSTIYTLSVKNYGKNDLTRVQVSDDLSATFGDSVNIDSVAVSADAGFKVNSNYTGRGTLINLLVDSLSTLPANTTRKITLFVRANLAQTTKRTFANSALAKGTAADKTTSSDISNTGTNPDPDADGDPTNNSIPTSGTFGTDSTGVVNVTTLGIAKGGKLDPQQNTDGSYNVTYTVVVRNYGKNPLTNIQLSDSLYKVFADSAKFAFVRKLTSISRVQHVKIDTSFNGINHLNLFVASSSTLPVGAADTLEFQIEVLNKHIGKANTVFKNSIYGTASDGTVTVTDVSQADINPDKNGNGNPGDDSEPTETLIDSGVALDDSTVVIPKGFSPNGDGVNDTFTIPGLTNTDRQVLVAIYNRYGGLVFRDENYGRSRYNGWDGKATEGVLLDTKNLVPAGVYYYYLQCPDYKGGQPVVSFLVVAH